MPGGPPSFGRYNGSDSLAATILVEVVVTVSALASFAALPGIRLNSALRQVKHSMNLSRRTFVIKAISRCEWSSPSDVKPNSKTY